MSEEQEQRRKARKGTTSCTECRRRKVRCIRDHEGAHICRRCQQQGSNCVEQTYKSKSSGVPRLSSRTRISQLESQVASLSKVVRDIESKLGHKFTPISMMTHAQPDSGQGADESDDDSSDSDILAANPPSQLHSLFHNDWLSVDTHPQGEQPLSRKGKVSSHLQNRARQALQDLIPSRDEVAGIAKSASRWLGLLHSLLPQPFAAKSQQEIIDSYDDMRNPDVDPAILASWLLTVALTAQQMPADRGSAVSQPQHISSFPRAVMMAVETQILPHDRLICTVEGLGMGIHFFRLQMSQGNLKKAWLRLRHFRAVAELMGLPKAFQIVQLNNASGFDSTEAQLHRAQLWEGFTFVDGLFGTLINLPPCISPYRQTNISVLNAAGNVQPRMYLSKLIDIATKIQYDNMNMEQGSTSELYSSVLDLDRQLQVLVSQTPKSWWVNNSEHVQPDHIIQFLHYCIKMRVHLFFAMRQDLNREYIYSRLACRDACETVAQRYQFLRGKLPVGIFICQILDLQVFTAAVVLLLTARSSPSADRSTTSVNDVKVDVLVSQVIKLMDENSAVTPGVNLAQNGVTTLRALRGLLQQDETSQTQELILKVPLLGKVYIRRNEITSRVPNPESSSQNHAPSSSGGIANAFSQGLQRPNHGLDFNMTSNFLPEQDFLLDPLTWSVENQFEDYFQDALMADDVGQFAIWQDSQGDFSFSR